jgi:hypothetical protein
MTRAVLAAIGLVLTLVGTGCGSPERVIGTPDVRRALSEAGFRNLASLSQKALAKQLARRFHDPTLAQGIANEDIIYVRGSSPLFGPISATRLSTVSGAKKAEASNRPILNGTATPEVMKALPPGVDVKRLRQERVCNVVLISYNRDGDPALTRRFDRAISLLQNQC